jgi:hypothetical protein
LLPQTATTEDKDKDKDKMESDKTVVVVDCDETTGAVVVAANKRGKNWPHMKFLCTEHKEILAKIFRAVDECKCTTELNAKDGDYPKGNNWNRLYDHFFGGGSVGRGLLAGHLPPLASATKLKLKIMDIWAYLKKESTNDYIKVDMDLVQTALRQEMEYEQSKAKEKAAADKQKHTMEVLQEKMQTYESSLGGLPPGANGTVGGGRQQHSTNLKTNEPAAYAYANITTGPDNKITPPPKKKVKVSSTTVNENGLAKLEKLGDTLHNGLASLMGSNGLASMMGSKNKDKKHTAVSKKKQVIYEKQAALEKSVLFYQKFPGNDKAEQAMATAMEQYMELTNELQGLLDGERTE